MTAYAIAAVVILFLLQSKGGGTIVNGGTAHNAITLVVPKLKQFEGFSPTPYPDYAQQSIGYGNKYVPGVTPNPLSVAQGEALLINSLQNKYLPGAKMYLQAKGIEWDELSVNKQAAILSFVYNLGEAIIASATWPEKYKAGNIAGAKASWEAHNKAGGKVLQHLVDRRKSEWRMFTTGSW